VNRNRLAIGLVILVCGLSSACTRRDSEEAKRKLRETGQELKHETREAGQKLKRGAHEASREIKKETGSK
jgi:hypothetical protein